MSLTTKRNKLYKEASDRDMHDRLIELAKGTFAKKGYVAASLRDIADQAGVTAAAVYYHFEKKEDLLREIIFAGLERIGRDVVEALASRFTPEQALEAVIRAHLRYNVDCPRESKIIIEDSRFLNEVDYAAVREKQKAVLNVYRACIRELHSSGRIGPIDPTLTAFNVISIILGWYRWFRESGATSKKDAFELTVRFAMSAVLNMSPPERRRRPLRQYSKTP